MVARPVPQPRSRIFIGSVGALEVVVEVVSRSINSGGSISDRQRLSMAWRMLPSVS